MRKCNEMSSFAWATILLIAGICAPNVAHAGFIITGGGLSFLDNDGLGTQIAPVSMSLDTIGFQSIRSANVPPNPSNPSFPGWNGSTTLLGGGFLSFGTMSGSISASAESTPSGLGVAETSGGITLQFDDAATVFSTNQPLGTPVTLDIRAELTSTTISGVFGGLSNPIDNFAFAEFMGSVRDLMTGQSVDFTIHDSTLSGFNSTPNFLQLSASVGDSLGISGRLTLHAEAKVGVFVGGATNALVSVDAAHTANFFIDAPSDFSILSDSGHNYSVTAVPEPSSLALILCGGMLLRWRMYRASRQH